ncbi:hypothetical protein [Sphingorhabdus sp. Alg231-15]|uniref:hypothetical protein n=1 Tax=Sphingorhabdus sp. Alg231-15 TaxID=1922222 RepID=UPI000D550630
MKKLIETPAVSAAVVACLVFSPIAVHAKAPKDVRDLVGSRGSSGEGQLLSRGYTHISTSKGDDRAWSYWWGRQSEHCISVVTRDGRYSSIDKVQSSDCGHKNSGSKTGTALAIGAAALIGALALSHKSHHHSKGSHGTSNQYEADYERGYRDGLHNSAYHNYDRSDAYSEGFSAGVEQRRHNISYRPGYGNGGGYRGYVNVNDLVGRSRSSAEATLTGRRGFSKIDSYKTDGQGRFTTYWRRDSKQCISVKTSKGYVRAINSMRNRNCR